MPDITTKDALLERMVAATEKLKTEIPAKFDDYLPLSGGTVTGDVNGVTALKNDNSKKMATTEFVANDLVANTFLLSDTFVPTFPNGADLNNYKTAGTYISTESSITNSLQNCPVSGVAFKMLVIYVGYNTIAYGGTQIIFANTGIFARRNSGNANNVTWGAWKTIVSYN